MANADEFDAFYHATRQRLLHQMYAMTGNLADAQDCVQEAYARAWQHWPAVSRHANPEAWLRTVAWRIAASRWRKIKNGFAALARHGPPTHAPEPNPDNVALVTALRQIPEPQRRAIVLHHLVGLSVEEIARETEVAVGTVKARLSRGRNALAELLRDPSPQDTAGSDGHTRHPDSRQRGHSHPPEHTTPASHTNPADDLRNRRSSEETQNAR